MRRQDMKVGEVVIYATGKAGSDGAGSATPFEILAVDAPLIWKQDEKTRHWYGYVPADAVEGLGVTVGLGSGGRDMAVSVYGRDTWRRPAAGVLAVQVDWAYRRRSVSNGSTLGGRTGLFAVLTDGHDIMARAEFDKWWTRRSMSMLAVGKDALYSAVAWPDPPERDQGHGGSSFGYAVTTPGGDDPLHPTSLTVHTARPADGCDLIPWIGEPVESFSVVADADGGLFRVDPRKLVPDPRGDAFKRQRDKVEQAATRDVRDRVQHVLRQVAAQVGEQAVVIVSTTSVTMPPAVLEALLFGDERITAEVLDGIAELRDTLADLRREA